MGRTLLVLTYAPLLSGTELFLSRPNLAVYDRTTTAVGVARIGTDSQCIISGTLEELLTVDYGPPLHSLVVPGQLHVMERELLATFACDDRTPLKQKVLEDHDEEEEPQL